LTFLKKNITKNVVFGNTKERSQKGTGKHFKAQQGAVAAKSNEPRGGGAPAEEVGARLSTTGANQAGRTAEARGER